MSGDSPAGAERNQAGPTCWSCAAAIGPRVLFCHACGKLQPPRSGEEEGGDAFARLGLPRRFDLDPAAVERQHAGFSVRLDAARFAARGQQEQQHAAAHRAGLDEARDMLSDPWSRALHLLELCGLPLVDRGAGDLSPACAAGRAALAGAALPAEVEPILDAAEDRLQRLFAELTTAFGTGDLDLACDLAREIGQERALIAEAGQRRAALQGKSRGQ